MVDLRVMWLVDLALRIFQELLLAGMELEEPLRMESSHTLTCTKIILERMEWVFTGGNHTFILNMMVISCIMIKNK